MRPEDAAAERLGRHQGVALKWYLVGDDGVPEDVRAVFQRPGQPPPIAFAGEGGVYDLEGPYLYQCSVADAGPPIVSGAGRRLPGAIIKDAPSGGSADAGGIAGVIDPVSAGVDNDRLSQQGQGVIEADALLPGAEGLGRSGHGRGGVIG